MCGSNKILPNPMGKHKITEQINKRENTTKFKPDPAEIWVNADIAHDKNGPIFPYCPHVTFLQMAVQ